MAQARGRNAQLLLDFETDFGTDPAAADAKQMPFYSNGLTGSRNLVEDTVIRKSRSPAQPSRGNVDVSGDIVVPVDVNAFGWWLTAMFGEPETTGESSPYTHVFALDDEDNTQPSLVLSKEFTDIEQYFTYNGCKVSRLSMRFGGDGELQATISIMGAKETLGEATYDAEPAEITLKKFSNFQAVIEEGGSSLAIGTEVSLDIDFDLDGDQYVIGGQGIRGDIPEGFVKVTGQLTALFEDDALVKKAINGTESSLKITLTNDTDKLEFLIPELLYEQRSPGIEGPKGVKVQLNYRGYYSDHEDEAVIKVTLTNGVESYAISSS
jgi:hypothetical protein